jgi:hypothetical protein
MSDPPLETHMPHGYRSDNGEPTRAKLMSIDRDQILALSRMGWSPLRISSAFPGISEASIHNLLAGRTFRTYEQQWAALHANDELPQAPYTQGERRL